MIDEKNKVPVMIENFGFNLEGMLQCYITLRVNLEDYYTSERYRLVCWRVVVNTGGQINFYNFAAPSTSYSYSLR